MAPSGILPATKQIIRNWKIADWSTLEFHSISFHACYHNSHRTVQYTGERGYMAHDMAALDIVEDDDDGAWRRSGRLVLCEPVHRPPLVIGEGGTNHGAPAGRMKAARFREERNCRVRGCGRALVPTRVKEKKGALVGWAFSTSQNLSNGQQMWLATHTYVSTIKRNYKCARRCWVCIAIGGLFL
jgi:hypothetical protein